jgi:tetratricopeptide (TPR) repeat protein
MLRILFQMLGDHYGQTNLRAVEIVVRSILATVPRDVSALHFLGLVYYRTNRRAAAVEVFNRAGVGPGALLAIAPGSLEDFLARNGYSAEAACQLEATRPSPGLAKAWYDVGLALAELGHPRRAVSAFRTSLVSQPEFPAARRAVEQLNCHIAYIGAHEGECLRLAEVGSGGNPAAGVESTVGCGH